MKNSKKIIASLYLLSVLWLFVGILGIFYPIIFSIYLIYILGTFFLFSGITNFIDGIKNLRTPLYHWGMSLFLGVIEVILFFSILGTPIRSELYLVIYIGILLLIKGLFIIFNSFGNKINLKTPHTSTGIISSIFGLLFVAVPLLSDQLIIITISWFIIFSGVDLFIIALGKNKD